jgi:hypothetical protein
MGGLYWGAIMSPRYVIFGCVGAITVSAVWIAVSWNAVPTVHSVLYDKCLATERTASTCDAAMRVIDAKRESIREQFEQDCRDNGARATLPDKDHSFGKIMGLAASASLEGCLEAIQARIDSLSFEFNE